MEDVNPVSIEDIEAQLKAEKEALQQVQEELAPLEQAKAAAVAEEQAAYQAYINQLAVIKASKEKWAESIFGAHSKMREREFAIAELERKKEAEQRRLEAEEREAKQREQWERMQEERDRRTMAAPWREWAKDHQITGGHHISEHGKVILADPMGLGKTLTSIISLDMIEAATKDATPEFPWLGEEKDVYVGYGNNPEDSNNPYMKQIVGGIESPVGRRVLYFCPAPLIGNVVKEFRNWAPHRQVAVVGAMPRAERKFVFSLLRDQPEYVIVCNYEAWRRDLSMLETLLDLSFDTIIIDEAHNIKNMKSSAYAGIKKLVTEMKPPFVIPMTGTPILNRPAELFSILSVTRPDQFRDVNFFNDDFCEQNDAGKWVFKPGGMKRLSAKIGDSFLRRTKEDAGIILPEKTITEHLLEVDEDLYPNQARVRDEMRKYAMIVLSQDKAIAAPAKIAMITRLRQIETWPAGIFMRDPLTKEITLQVDVEESQKVDYLIKWNQEDEEYDGLIPEVVQDERSVVFSQFKAPLRELASRCERAGIRAVVLDGDTPSNLKQEIMDDFDIKYTPTRADSKWDVVLANYRVGGVGMNLTCATQMFILDEEWNPGKRDQAYDRIHRIGQEKPVTIHVLRDEKTIDDWMAGIIDLKQSVVDEFDSTMSNQALDGLMDALGSGLI